jgi:Zn-finger nucleic acid-binding protein
MKCPDCGATLEPTQNLDSSGCAHCGSSFPAATADGVTVLGEKVDAAACPICRLPLVAALIEDQTVCYCTQCHGFLAKMDTFATIVTRRRARHRPNGQRPDPFDPAELKRVVTCPGCAQRMETHPYFGGGNAVVDTCESCSLIWLDPGELAIIERYIPHTHQIERTLTLWGGRYQDGPTDMLW